MLNQATGFEYQERMEIMKQRIVLSEDVRIPKSTIILEKGDIIGVLSEEEWEDYDLVPEDDFFPEDDYENDIGDIEIETDEVIIPDEIMMDDEVIIPDDVMTDEEIIPDEEPLYLAGEYPEGTF